MANFRKVYKDYWLSITMKVYKSKKFVLNSERISLLDWAEKRYDEHVFTKLMAKSLRRLKKLEKLVDKKKEEMGEFLE